MDLLKVAPNGQKSSCTTERKTNETYCCDYCDEKWRWCHFSSIFHLTKVTSNQKRQRKTLKIKYVNLKFILKKILGGERELENFFWYFFVLEFYFYSYTFTCNMRQRLIRGYELCTRSGGNRYRWRIMWVLRKAFVGCKARTCWNFLRSKKVHAGIAKFFGCDKKVFMWNCLNIKRSLGYRVGVAGVALGYACT